MNRVLSIVVFLFVSALSVLSCRTDGPSGMDNFPSNKPEEENSGTDPDQDGGKPCFVWIDAAANFPDFANSRAAIVRDLTKAADAGFTDIVVDVRPTTGDVLFQTDNCQQVEWLSYWGTSGQAQFHRTATWDYLQAFIDEGHKLGLRVYASINTFVGGNATAVGNAGAVFRDPAMAELTTVVNTADGFKSIMDLGDENGDGVNEYSAKFFNPVHPDVQVYLFSLLEDLAAYKDLDGIILDRGRFDSIRSDFSDYTREQFESYIGTTLANWPEDVMPVNWAYADVPSPEPQYFRKWLEFRAKVIHDFMEEARNRVKAVNPDVDFGVYVGGWYSTYFAEGVNWASPSYNTGLYHSWWATDEYRNFGYADHMDVMLIGAYAAPNKVTGTTEWTMEGFCRLAKDKTAGGPRICAGGPDVGNWDSDNEFSQELENQAITQSVTACANACDGYFLFDMCHLRSADQWSYAKAGIDALRASEE